MGNSVSGMPDAVDARRISNEARIRKEKADDEKFQRRLDQETNVMLREFEKNLEKGGSIYTCEGYLCTSVLQKHRTYLTEKGYEVSIYPASRYTEPSGAVRYDSKNKLRPE
jgi:hypothetical protein